MNSACKSVFGFIDKAFIDKARKVMQSSGQEGSLPTIYVSPYTGTASKVSSYPFFTPAKPPGS